MTNQKVFNWLGNDSGGTPYYLHLLNLVWSPEGVEHDLAVYQRVASQLGQDSHYWKQIIREHNWRFSLVGSVAVILEQPEDMLDDLLYRFENGSWVSPQLAVAAGLVYPSDTIDRMLDLLSKRKVKRNPKACGAIFSVLSRIGASIDQPKKVDPEADHIVKQHWDFWKKHLK